MKRFTDTIDEAPSVIDVHQHLWPGPLIAALRQRSEPPRLHGWHLELAGHPPFEADPADHDMAVRTKQVALDGLDLALVSLSCALGVEGLGPAESGELLEAYHEGVLELPEEPGAAQDLFRVRPEASYIVAMRNPAAEAPPGVGLRPAQRPGYPPELMERFGNRRFIALDDPRFLDIEDTELVLIGAAEDAEAELGVHLDREQERLEHADIFRQLRIRPDELPVEPLARGELR